MAFGHHKRHVPAGSAGRITRRNVIENSAGAFPCGLRARDKAEKYVGDCKTKRLWTEDQANICEFVL